MTDGIIQEVFYKELHYYDNYTSLNPDMTIDEHLQVLEALQQEIIEKIKKTHFSNEYMFDIDIKKKLIGDNQE